MIMMSSCQSRVNLLKKSSVFLKKQRNEQRNERKHY